MRIRPAKSFAELVDFPKSLGPVPPGATEAHGTTVLALRFDKGILNLGDRRATSANFIMYDKAEKILSLDDSTMVAISGSFARSVEIVRYLSHAFKYYARTQLQDMSLEGKLQEVSRALSGNLSMTMEGIGIFVPVVSAYDEVSKKFGIYFYDAMGARFESGAFAAAGSGSERIRGVFDYITRSKGPFDTRPLEDVLKDGMQMLDIAAQLDSATGGLEHVPPLAKTLTAEGIRRVEDEVLASAIHSVTKAG
ncbi:MAG: Proteasome subunit beta [Fimbriimonadales bacterium]|nr:MAG: proteasome subunit alpha [Armatimonadota bacterium]MBV6502508.1 Proteasome subunit beta [Fimbriimonadales bacterium]MCE7898649.1 proteasome subunit alpha [Armatimonadetes bacterium ATM1]MDL1928058.1 proteasome subunit alpha [Fimbriimonadia bacterium ATM]MBC6968512.1 proteasome subunit alpha [Armatimonadota bacterium]